MGGRKMTNDLKTIDVVRNNVQQAEATGATLAEIEHHLLGNDLVWSAYLAAEHQGNWLDRFLEN